MLVSTWKGLKKVPEMLEFVTEGSQKDLGRTLEEFQENERRVLGGPRKGQGSCWILGGSL